MKRNSNIEILRIISMFLIVLCHFATYGNFDFSQGIFVSFRLWWNFIELGGNLGGIVFLLITGYYSIEKKNNNNIIKIITLWSTLLFYSILSTAVGFITNNLTLSIPYIIKMVMPVVFEQWWFASAFIILLVIQPYLNKMLNSFSKKEYKNYLITIFIIWCIIPTFTASMNQSNSLIQMIMWYSIGGYIYKYKNDYEILKKQKMNLTVFIIAELLIYLSSIAFMIFETKISIFSKYVTFFYSKKSFLVLIGACALFIYCINKKEKNIRIINSISSITFGVYLFHEHPIIRDLLWKKIFANYNIINSYKVIPYSIIVASCVFVTAALIEYIRKKTIERLELKLVNKIIKKEEGKENV